VGAGPEFELRDDAPPRIVEMPGHLPDGGADFLRIARRKRVLPVNLAPEGDQEAQHEISSYYYPAFPCFLSKKSMGPSP